MAKAVEIYLKIELRQLHGRTTAQIFRLQRPLRKHPYYSVRCLSQPHIVTYLYWLPALPDRSIRDRLLPDLESFVKNVIATDADLYAALAPQLTGEDWSFADEKSTV